MSQVQSVKEASDIIQIIGERLTLQRSGSNFRSNCPFHSEKSPSFFVNEQFQRYKCFGCGESGDVFNFLQKYEGMTFGEALKYLADRAGIELEHVAPDPAEAERGRLLAILELAKDYYHYLLTQHELGAPAREYLKQRGINQESIKLFRLGYALPAWEGLVQFLHGKKKYEVADLISSGLVTAGRTGKPYDRFRDRLMFPLANHRGQIVGFSGRLLSGDAKEAKYINTPETMLYHKSQMLFGLSELYQPIRTAGEVVVVEGEFDVISSAQVGVNHVVAIKGSALTTEHAKLLSRVADRVLLSLDMDSAGVEATKRAISVIKPTNLELRVLQLPSGKDPDELARHQPAAWREAVKASISVYDFFLQAAAARFDPNTPEGKRHIMEELAPILNDIPLVVEQEVYIKKLADLLKTSPTAVKTDIERLMLRRQAVQKVGHRPAVNSTPAASPQVIEFQKLPVLEQFVVFALLRSTPAQFGERVKQVQASWFTFPPARHLVTAGQSLVKPVDPTLLIKTLASDIQNALFEAYLDPNLTQLLEKIDLSQEWPLRLASLKSQATQQEQAEVAQQLRELEALPDRNPSQQRQYEDLIARSAALQKQARQPRAGA